MENTMYKYLLDTISESEKKRLFEEMDADPGLRARMVELQNNHALADMVSVPGDEAVADRGLDELRKMSAARTAAAQTGDENGGARAAVVALTGVERRGTAAQVRTRTRRLYEWTARRVAVAAVIVAVVVGAGVVGLVNHSGGTGEGRLTQVTAPTGKRMELTLPDGTIVWLAPGSSLEYPAKFGRQGREVHLSGEALFDVTSDPRNPFEVRSGGFSVRALGTIFNTSSYRGAFETTLIEGVVEVYENTNPDGRITMKPNHRVRLNNGRLECSEADAAEALGLQKGIYNFHDVTFGEIMARLEVWYGVEIEILDGRMADQLFSAKFRESDDIETILKALQKTSWFEFARTPGDGGATGRITIRQAN